MEFVFLGCAGVLMAMLFAGWYCQRPWRALPDPVVDKLKSIPTKRPNQHLVDLVLEDGRVISRVYVAWGRFPSISPKRLFRPFRPDSVVDARPTPQKTRPDQPRS
jgi:hypothetical protein